MKIRTDFVTNSSSSSYVCEKVATFTLFDKSGAGTDITFQRHDFKFDGDEEFSDGDINVPELFNEFLVVHYKNTQKVASASVLLNGLLSGKKTPMIKEFIKSVGMEDISEQILYFCVENAQVSSSVGSRLDGEWEEFLKHLNIEYWGIGDYAEFIKAYKAEHRYNFMVFSFGDQDVMASNRFNHGYDRDTEFVFGEIKQHFAKENDSIIAEASKKYLPNISSRCNLSKDVLEAIEKGDIKVIFFAKDTGVCDEIIWYSGELKKENIRIHLFAEGEEVTDIDDNTDDINSIITEALNTTSKMVKPTDKKEIVSKANKEKQAEVIDSLSSDVFDEPLSEEMKKSGKKRLATVLFADNKKYKYFCEFPVQEGDKVYVEGKKAGELGVVIEVSDNLPKGTAATYTLNVTRAFFKEQIMSQEDEAGNTEYKVISMTKEEAKGIWTTKKDAMGHLHIVAYKGEGDSTLYIPSEIGGEKIDIVGLSGSYDMISKKRKSAIKRVIIGDGVRHIGRFAFAEMENLQSIIIPPSVTYISPFAFHDTDLRGVNFVSDYSYADSLVDYIGEYTGQFSLEGKSICFIDTDWDYRIQTVSVNEYKPLIASLGAVFQQKPNTRTALIVIRDDFSCNSDKLNAVFELIQSGKIEVKAITEEKFLNMVNKPVDKSDDIQYSSLAEKYARGISDKVKYIELAGKGFRVTTLTKEDWIINYIERHGGILKSTVTGNTDYVIIGNTIQDKTNTVIDAEVQRAKGSNIRALTESEFLELIHEQEKDPKKYEQFRQEELKKDLEREQERQRKEDEKRAQEEREIELAREKAAQEAAIAEEQKAIKAQNDVDAECDRIDQVRAEEREKYELLSQNDSQEEFMPVDLSIKPIYAPGSEPVNIKKRLDTLFPKLKEAYPNMKISSLQKDHKKWAETVTELYRLLGYPDGNTFLYAYGFKVIKNKSGRSNAFDPYYIIEELGKRYPYGSGFARLEELFAANPDLDGNTKSLMNKSNDLFGMPLAKYLKYLGILGPVLHRSSESIERKNAEEEAKRAAEEERKRKEEEAKKTAEEERKRKEEEAKKAAEEERKRKEEEAKKTAEEERKRKEEEAKRAAEEERKRKEAEAKKAAEEEEKRKNAIKAWETQCEDILSKKDEDFKQYSASVDSELQGILVEIEKKKQVERQKCEEQIMQLEKEISKVEQELASLGFFGFGKKKQLKEMLDSSKFKLTKFKDELKLIESKYDKDILDKKDEAEEKKRQYKNSLESKYVLPKKPE